MTLRNESPGGSRFCTGDAVNPPNIQPHGGKTFTRFQAGSRAKQQLKLCWKSAGRGDYSFNKNNKIKNAWRPDATDKGIGLKSVKYIAVNEQLLRYCVVLTKH